MKIPLYRSQARPTTEAPGRSFTARMNPEPYVREALAKGNLVTEAVSQVGEYTKMRYKMAQESLLNDALIGADEQLREEYYKFSKTNSPHTVLDGDNPEWDRTVNSIKDGLRSKIGQDKLSLQTFDEAFRKTEIQQRFRLRTLMDQKIEANIQAARRRNLEIQETNAVEAETSNDLTFAIGNVVSNSDRLNQVLQANPDALKSQEYAWLKNVARRRVQNVLEQSGAPITAVSKLREAAFLDENAPDYDDKLSEILSDPSLNGKGIVEFELLKMLKLDDKISLLRSGETVSQYIDGPTLEQQKSQRIAKTYGTQASQSIDDYISRLEQGQTVPGGEIDATLNVASQAVAAMDPEAAILLQEKVGNLEYIRGLSQQVKGVANVKDINDMILAIEAGDTFGGEGIQPREQLGLEFLRNFKDNMEKQLTDDPIGYASTTGSVKIAPIDLSPEAVQAGSTGIPARIQSAVAVQGHYDLSGPIKLLTPSEVAIYAPSLNQGTALDRMQAISSIQQLFGDYAPAVLQQLAKDAPVTTHVAGLIRDGLAPEAEIIMKGVQEIEANGVPIEGTDMREAEGQMFAILGGAYELLPGQLNASLKKNVKDTALAYYAEVLSRRVDKAFDGDLWAEAVQVSTGYNRRTGQGGIQEVRGKPTLLPPNRTPDEIENALSQVNRENFSAIAATQMIDEDTFNDIKSDGDYSLQVLGRRNGKIVYGVVYGEYGESGYAIMTDQDGGDIMFTAEDLVNAARASEATRPTGLAARPGIRAAAEPAPQQAPSDQGFDIRSYDRSDPAQTNQATIEISKIIANNFDVGSVGVDEVRSYLREQRIPHSNKMIETAINVAKQTGGNVMSGYLPDEFKPSAFASTPRRKKPQGGNIENLFKSYDANLMQSASSPERYIKETWEPIVDEIEAITGKSFKNPGSYIRPNVFEIVTGEAARGYGQARYSYETNEIEKFVRDNRDVLPEELAVAVLDPDRDAVWKEASRERFGQEQAELAEITERSPGIGPATFRLLGALAAGAEDPLNQAFMVTPVARVGKGLLGLAFGEALTNAGVEAIQQPGVAEWYESLGLEYTWEEFATNVGGAAVIGGSFPIAIKVGADTVRLTADQVRKGKEVLSNAMGGKADIQEAAEILEEAANSIAESNPLGNRPIEQVEHQSRLTEATVALNDGQLPKISDQPRAQVKVPENINEATNLRNLVDEFNPRDIQVDAKTFQFKEGGDIYGVTDRLEGVTQWDPIKAGMVTIYEYADGGLFIADGHQRLGLANRILDADPTQDVRMVGFRLREIDGITPEEAMVIAALKNISEGTGTAIDAAKILRAAPERISELPPRSAFVRQATALARLANEAWGMVKNEIVPPNHAAVVGRLIDDPALQKAALDVLAKTEPANEFQAEAIVRQVRETDLTTETQESLFGEEVLTQSLFMERAKVLDRAQKQLRKDKSAFQNLIKNADRLEGEGNKLAQDANKRRANDDGKAIALLQSQANRKGALSDALTVAARQAKESGNYNAATRGFVEDVRRAISDGEFDRAEVSDVGRTFDAPKEIPAIRTDAEEGQLNAFDDMFGQGSIDQIAALEADVLGDIVAQDAAKAKANKPVTMPDARVVRLKDMDFQDAKVLESQLKAEQNFVDVDDLMNRAAANHDELTAEIKRAADIAKAKQKVASLKERDRVEEKIRDKYAGDTNRITDVARGGIEAETDEAAEAFIEALSERYRVIDEGYAFTDEGYFDRKLAVIFDDGQIGEVQIWPPGMLDAKENRGGHDLYKIKRSQDETPEARQKAVEDMLALYADVKNSLSEGWIQVIDRQTSSGNVEPSLVVKDETISRVTSGERSSERTSLEEIGPQDPSLASEIIEPGDVSMAGIDPSTRKNLMDTSDADVLLDELKVKFGEDFEVPVGRKLDEESGEILPTYQTIRQLKDEFDQDTKMLDRLRGCAK